MLHGYFDIPNFVFFNARPKNVWTGSLMTYFSYRMDPIKRPPEEGESELHLMIWYGRESFENVKEFVAEYPEELSQAGIDACLEHLTEEFEKFKAHRKELGF